MVKYNHKKIEKKWQKEWEKQDLYKAIDFDQRPKKYIMVEFPYPSGDGLHMGHPRSYCALDALVRKKRMEGYNVLYPMGWDAFGLPTENYAIKTGIHPREVTKQNIKVIKGQLKALGLSFDWSREINTTDPEYYKWSQWIFLQFFKKGLAYQAQMPINWCPSCRIGLAHEEVIAGKCERCGAQTEQKNLKQWMLKITAYADRLIDDLEKVDYAERIKKQQINWIGRSYGVEIDFPIEGVDESITIFTTRPDTLFGVTAMTLAPEHPLVGKIIADQRKKEVEEYIQQAKKKSEFERTQLEKEKTGVFTGAYCLNPANQEKTPIWVSDYVVASYGGGAVMIVPAHDKRDYAFAKKFGLGTKQVVSGGEISKGPYLEYGKLINSGQFNGLSSEKAIKEIIAWLEQKGAGRQKVNYKLRDWVFSRQHYWGEPIPIIHCPECGAVPAPEDQLPVKLPEVEKYQPTETAESPLANIKEWVEVKCPQCGGPGRRETDTMPNWAGSSWYFLRYLDPKNQNEFADFKKMEYWLPVDLYNGGMEHTTLHLLYSRFWHKFLYDLGYAPTEEPYQRRVSHGIVLAEDGRKMSKSFGNVIRPDEIVEKYGADTLRVYEMFMGPFDQAIAWSDKSMRGCWRFLNRIWQFYHNQQKIGSSGSQKIIIKLHQTIKKVSQDLEAMKFNTAIAAMMEFINLWSEKEQSLSRQEAEAFLKILAPFAPHLSEELWQKMGNRESIFKQVWPEHSQDLIQEETYQLIIQINGKVRDKIEVKQGISEEEAKKMALNREKIKRWLSGQEPKKVIYLANRLINIVV